MKASADAKSSDLDKGVDTSLPDVNDRKDSHDSLKSSKSDSEMLSEMRREVFESRKRLKTNTRTSVTKCMNAVYRLMRNDANLEGVIQLRHKMNEKCNELEEAFSRYIVLAPDESKYQQEKVRHREIQNETSSFFTEVDAWIEEVQNRKRVHLEEGTRPQPSDMQEMMWKMMSMMQKQMVPKESQEQKTSASPKTCPTPETISTQTSQGDAAAKTSDQTKPDVKLKTVKYQQDPLLPQSPLQLPHGDHLKRQELQPPHPVNDSYSANVGRNVAAPVFVPASSGPPVQQTFAQLPGYQSTSPEGARASNTQMNWSGYPAYDPMIQMLQLPKPEIVKFDGDPMDYTNFQRSFEARVMNNTTSGSDRLYFLHQCLEGEPKELVSSCLYLDGDRGFEKAMSLLKNQYGEPHVICNAFMRKFHDVTHIKADDAKSLRNLYLMTNKCLYSMQALGDMSVVDFPANLQLIVTKLPPYLRNKWKDQVSRYQRRVCFEDLVEFLHQASNAANDPIFGNEALFGASKSSVKGKREDHKEISFTAFTKPRECYLCSGDHLLKDCPQFKEMSVEERSGVVRNKKLCFRCFGMRHGVKTCKIRVSCSKCRKNHQTLLHDDNFKGKPRTPEHSTQSSACQQDSTVLHAILPVNVSVGGKSVMTYALFDNGSSASFMTDSLISQLHATGSHVTLKLITMHGRTSTDSTLIENVVISDVNHQYPIVVKKMYSRYAIPVTEQHIAKPEVLKARTETAKFSHLIPKFIRGLGVGLLIGANCPAALEPLEVRSGGSQSCPFAFRLRHGWVLNGPLGGSGNDTDVHCFRISLRERQKVGEVLVHHGKDFESFAAECSSEKKMSREDHLFMAKVKEGTIMTEGHYQVPLPVKDENLKLPNNAAQAYQRTACLKKKFKNDEYRKEYSDFMKSLLDKGYAEEAPLGSGRERRTWYLPHHGVRHPQKKKLRVVFDCSAEFRGYSLNEFLLQGPNLTSSIVGVLTRFREGEVCFMSDIEAMFHQVKVPEEDRDLLRFLWWPNGNVESPLRHYRMTVHLFGATSSPAVCNFALRRITEDFECSQAVASTILTNFYVDDCLKSVTDVSEATGLIEDLTKACSKGGFHLHKFISNNKDVLKTIPVKELVKDVQHLDLDQDALPHERTLGLQWNIAEDEFGFSFGANNKPATRRGLLSTISSIYDPLGILSPFVLPARLLVQDLCREGIGWDDEIPEDVKRRWEQWTKSMHSIAGIRIKRHLEGYVSETSEIQMHVFSDASSTAYGAVAYVRVQNGEKVMISFLMGKSRVKPLRAVTIPRMELIAATVAARMGATLSQELGRRPSQVFYHTDSTSVLHFLCSHSKRFPVFVSNRVQTILDLSTPEQWRYIPSEQNPADQASRGLSFNEDYTHKMEQWLHGPEFLIKQQSEWPQLQELDPAHLETVLYAVTQPEETDVDDLDGADDVDGVNKGKDRRSLAFDRLMSSFSSWSRLKRAVCVFLRVKEILKSKVKGSLPPTGPHVAMQSLEESERVILQHIQRECFYKEVRDLTRSGVVRKNSSVFRLDPFLKDGLLRVGGRLKHGKLTDDATHPVLLPQKNHITTLIVRHCHESLKHAGRNHVLATLRQKYWIIHSNSVVRGLIWRCVTCRRLRKPQEDQKMSDLPNERLSTDPPFTHSGVDLFGPFYTKNGRKEVKRYGVLFTCLSCRAVHLEVANSLESTSFINALRRFIARRGQVKTLFCDNGTNLVGASKELRDGVRSLERCEESLREILLEKEITWNFNPPNASHWGGAWERQIRSVRSTLGVLLKEFGSRIDDEMLATLLCEAESIINSRPLTAISDDVDDLAPLSPGMLLTLKKGGGWAPISTTGCAYARKRWKQVQYLADLFWSRWRREYLQSLQSRQKWATPKRNVQVGDIVLLVEANIARSQWSLGRIIEATAGKDDLVRSVVVRVRGSEYRRPVNKCILVLPVEDQ